MEALNKQGKHRTTQQLLLFVSTHHTTHAHRSSKTVAALKMCFLDSDDNLFLEKEEPRHYLQLLHTLRMLPLKRLDCMDARGVEVVTGCILVGIR